MHPCRGYCQSMAILDYAQISFFEQLILLFSRRKALPCLARELAHF